MYSKEFRESLNAVEAAREANIAAESPPILRKRREMYMVIMRAPMTIATRHLIKKPLPTVGLTLLEVISLIEL